MVTKPNIERERSRTPTKKKDFQNSEISKDLLILKKNNSDQIVNLIDTFDVKEEIPDEKEIKKLKNVENIHEADDRYKHEKKKISFIIYVVRGIRKLSKYPEFFSINEDLCIIAFLLSKKAIVLNDWNYLSLKNGLNILELPGFEDLIKSEKVNKVLEYFLKRKMIYESYLDHLIEKMNEIKLSVENKKVIEEASNPNILLSDLDDKMMPYYNKAISFEVKNSEIRHDFVLMMVSIYYAINCESYFPYKLNNAIFNWDLFYDMHENMNDQQLWEIISH